MKKLRKISIDIHSRFKDIDAMGHVNNALYFTYFEEARKAFLFQVLNIVSPSDYPFILAKASCDYIKPITLYDQVSVDIWIGNIGTKSFAFFYQIRDHADDSIIFGRGETVMVLYDYTVHKTMPISDELLHILSDYCEK